jgi:hypothetical protein
MVDGYPSVPQYGDPVSRLVYGWEQQSSDVQESDDTTTRVITRLTVLVPNVSPYKPRDKVTISGLDFFVAATPNDMTTGPFGYTPGGTVLVERVDG